MAEDNIQNESITKKDLIQLQSSLSQSITELTESVKKILLSTNEIPNILDRLEKIEQKTSEQLTEINSRLLINEEEIEKIWEVLNKQKGKEKLVNEQIKSANDRLYLVEEKQNKANSISNEKCELSLKALNKSIEQIQAEQYQLREFHKASMEVNVNKANKEPPFTPERTKQPYENVIFDHDVILLTDSNGKSRYFSR